MATTGRGKRPRTKGARATSPAHEDRSERSLPDTFADKQAAVDEAVRRTAHEDLLYLGVSFDQVKDEFTLANFIAAKAGHKRADEQVSVMQCLADHLRRGWGVSVSVSREDFVYMHDVLRDPSRSEWQRWQCCHHFIIDHSDGGCVVPGCNCTIRGPLPPSFSPRLPSRPSEPAPEPVDEGAIDDARRDDARDLFTALPPIAPPPKP